jgi:hypothetical protein
LTLVKWVNNHCIKEEKPDKECPADKSSSSTGLVPWTATAAAWILLITVL